MVDAVEPDEPQSATVELTEVANDSDLFNDPDLDVARLEPGDERAIVVPRGTGRKRWRNSTFQIEPLATNGSSRRLSSLKPWRR